MGCKTVLSQTTSLKTGHFAVHTNNLRHYLNEFAKYCGQCNTRQMRTYKQPLHSNLTNVGDPRYCRLFQCISVDLLGPLFIKTPNNSKKKIYILFVLDVLFYAVTYYVLDNVKAFDVKIALKPLEAQYGEIRYFSSDSGSQLRESKINSKDSLGNYFFNWTLSKRTGPMSQKHNLVESRVKTFKRFCRKIFNAKFHFSRQITELILTAGCMSINRIPVDANQRTIISPADLLYPTLNNDNRTFATLDSSSMQNIFDVFKQKLILIKQAYNDILTANFHLYSKRNLKHPSPELNLFNIVIFQKENDLFYGVVTGILNDQVVITCKGTEYTRPRSEIFHVAAAPKE